ncbi:MAG: hypothetical protein EHM72_11900 [Calditrichaeota bacterium]|nr:MAG: hypothetical protein EHM72_11900 [Calditrichota bacterium]
MKICTMIVLLTAALPLQAEVEKMLSLTAGFAVPNGVYGRQSDDPQAGFAKFGFSGGIEYDHFPGIYNLAWSTAFQYIVNDYENDIVKRGTELTLYETGAYSIYSLMTGLKWQKNLGENFALFALAQAGYFMANGPFLSGYTDENSPLVELEMNRSSAFGYALGVGFLANQRTCVSFRYINAGDHSYSKSVNYTDDDISKTASLGWDVPIRVFMINVGYTIVFD